MFDKKAKKEWINIDMNKFNTGCLKDDIRNLLKLTIAQKQVRLLSSTSQHADDNMSRIMSDDHAPTPKFDNSELTMKKFSSVTINDILPAKDQ